MYGMKTELPNASLFFQVLNMSLFKYLYSTLLFAMQIYEGQISSYFRFNPDARIENCNLSNLIRIECT